MIERNGLLIVVLLVLSSLLIMVAAGAANHNTVHMNGNEIDCCVRYTADTNNELEGYFYTDIKVALPLQAPSLGLKWDNDIADDDVMGIPNYM